MIKFFRHIRQNQIMSNNTGKYFKYAIGEIILVVIGILIALQINNWNEEKKLKTNELALLTSLQNELENNISAISASVRRNDSILNFSRVFMERIISSDHNITENSITSCLNYFPLAVQSPVLDNILSNNSNLKTTPQNTITELRKLKYTYEDIDNFVFYLDELWNSKITSFFVDTGLSYHKSKLNRSSQISFDDIKRYGYSKRQFIALLDLTRDLLDNYIAFEKRALTDSEAVLLKLTEGTE